MRILLDENFPLRLVRKLREANYEAEHIILLGKRGTPDTVIRDRLTSEEILFLTTDQEFLSLPLTRSSVIAAFRYPLAVSRRTPVASSIRRSGHPSRPNATT